MYTRLPTSVHTYVHTYVISRRSRSGSRNLSGNSVETRRASEKHVDGHVADVSFGFARSIYDVRDSNKLDSRGRFYTELLFYIERR